MKANHHGYTLIELTVVMFVIAILAGVVLTGARGLLHRQRFNDAQEHFRSMVLTARNRSQTMTNGSSTIGVKIIVGDNATITLFEDKNPKNSDFNSPPDSVIDTLQVDKKDFTVSVMKDANAQCLNSATILFSTSDETADLKCDDQNAGVNLLKINFQSTQIASSLREFLILKQAGVLQ